MIKYSHVTFLTRTIITKKMKNCKHYLLFITNSLRNNRYINYRSNFLSFMKFFLIFLTILPCLHEYAKIQMVDSVY